MYFFCYINDCSIWRLTSLQSILQNIIRETLFFSSHTKTGLSFPFFPQIIIFPIRPSERKRERKRERDKKNTEKERKKEKLTIKTKKAIKKRAPALWLPPPPPPPLPPSPPQLSIREGCPPLLGLSGTPASREDGLKDIKVQKCAFFLDYA